jgi:type II secretion system protein C
MNKTRVSRLLLAIKISLVAMIVYVAVSTVVVPLRLGETFKPKEASGREHQESEISDLKSQIPQATPDYSIVANSRLFGDSARESEISNLKSQIPPAPVKEEELSLKLVGTIASGPDSSRAIIQDCKMKITNPYKIGETVASATIESIERDKVVLRYHGRTQTLLLTTDTTMPKVKSSDPNVVRTSSVASAATGASSPSSDRLGQVEALFRKATIEPYVDQGQPEGLRITGLDDIPIAAAFGLKNGDVIQSVNGQVLTSKQKAFQVLQKAKAQSKVNMQLLRDGRVTDLSFNNR